VKITNNYGFPEALVKAITRDRHNKPGQLSATTLLAGTKQILLRDRHWEKLEEDVEDLFWAIYGIAVHKVLEGEGENDFSEELMAHKMDGITITGRIDNYNMKTGEITDWKSASVWKITNNNFLDWRRQGLIYAWLLLKNGFEVKTCKFIALLKDHKKSEARRNSSYPQKPFHVYQFDVTPESLAEIETYLKEKLTEYNRHKEMKDDEIPPCSAEERWDRPTKYAVRKNANKRATRVMDTLEEAEKLAVDMGKDYVVDVRPGESIRCMDYCACSEFCNYYRNNVATAETQEAVAA
jgi:hypothetical protein